MTAMEFMTGSCCVIGAIVVAVFVSRVLRDLWLCLCDWLRIKRFVWMYGRDACITEQELEDLAFNEANHWWKYHEKERVWCRFDDYRAGMIAASKAILRQRGMHVVRNKPTRKQAPKEAREKGQ